MQRVVGEGDDVPSKRRHIHGGEEGVQLLGGRRRTLRRPFTVCKGHRHADKRAVWHLGGQGYSLPVVCWLRIFLKLKQPISVHSDAENPGASSHE
jgi:hypothetical protein